jgi:hypothetical protein
MDYTVLIVLGLAVIFLAMAIRIANENERFAVFAIGRFVGLKGPGLVLKMPGGGADLVRIALGAEGEVQSNELVLIAGRAMRYSSKDPIRSGARVRVSGFDAAGVQVEPLQKFIVCEKCGHKNAL